MDADQAIAPAGPAGEDRLGRSMKGINDYWRSVDGAARESFDHRTAIGGLWDEIGPLQLEFLKAEGLRPDHVLFDIGCGSLRGGVHFVRYLEPGRYHGLDINASLLEAGAWELDRAGLGDKGARLLADDGFEVARFGVCFDLAIAVSVFTHLYANHILRCLVRAREAMHAGSRFYATYFEAPTARHLGPIRHEPGGIVTHPDADPFHYSLDQFRALADQAGLAVERIGDWGHPRAQRMLRFTPVGPI